MNTNEIDIHQCECESMRSENCILTLYYEFHIVANIYICTAPGIYMHCILLWLFRKLIIVCNPAHIIKPNFLQFQEFQVDFIHFTCRYNFFSLISFAISFFLRITPYTTYHTISFIIIIIRLKTV